MGALSEWLNLAPKPSPLKEGQKWHVFLSYRSVHRSWVIQLYDILRHLGYEVFLDQYVLSANDNLVLKLSEALGKSAAGVLVWSKATVDSEWCQDEYATMVAREKRDKDFHFVVAKLDQGELPEFAGLKIYQDFSDYREGPCGSGLLRLVHGLSDQPLSGEAIRFSESVDQDFRDSLYAIRAAREIGDGEKLVRLTKSETPAWTSSSLLASQAAEGLISLARYDDALAVLTPVGKAFSKSIRPKQLMALALRREGDWQAAQDILSTLAAAGEMDPETMGIYAATWMDRYSAENNELYLRKARDLYAQAFLNSSEAYYVGINAAAKSAMLADREASKEYAERVEKIVGDKPKPGDYWMTATVAEVQLLKGNFANAAELYHAAVLIEPESVGSHESSWKQAKLLMEKLETSPEDYAQVAKAFGHLKPTAGAPRLGSFSDEPAWTRQGIEREFAPAVRAETLARQNMHDGPQRLPPQPPEKVLHFGQADLYLVRNLLLEAGFARVDREYLLFVSMNTQYVSMLPTEGAPDARLLAVLDIVNRTPRLSSGEVPLRTLLFNAVENSKPLPESQKLQKFLDLWIDGSIDLP